MDEGGLAQGDIRTEAGHGGNPRSQPGAGGHQPLACKLLVGLLDGALCAAPVFSQLPDGGKLVSGFQAAFQDFVPDRIRDLGIKWLFHANVTQDNYYQDTI